jgi:uncharacterized membrane protein YkoI
MRTPFIAPLALALAACGGTSTPDAPSSAGGEAAFTWGDAIAAARAADPSFVPTEVEIESVEGRELVEVEGIRGDEVVERYYDPATGELVQEGTEALDEEETAALPTLRQRLSDGEARLEDVLAMARRAYPEGIREVELEMHGDALIFEVTVEVDGEARVFVHDPATGAVIGEEQGEEM